MPLGGEKLPSNDPGPVEVGVTQAGWRGPRADRWESGLHQRPQGHYIQILAMFLSLRPQCSSTPAKATDTKNKVLPKQGCSPVRATDTVDMVTTTTERAGQPRRRLK